MLNIGKLVGGNWDYYLAQIARSQEEYYTGTGEAPGYWVGSLAQRLGLAGEVSEEGLHRLLAGAHPDTAARLTAPARGSRIAGFDLAFRAPKSVSLIYALGDPAAAAAVRQAHERAIEQALGYLERHATFVRRGHAGVEQLPGQGMAAAAFGHRTSRAGDPLLHTHVLVGNFTLGPDGRFTALDGRLLYAHAKTAGYLYQAALRTELTRRLGVGWRPVVRGSADIAGIPRRVIEAFSTRRREITEQMARLGVRSARAAQTVTLATRRGKEPGVTTQTLRGRWQQRAGELGWGRDELVATFRVRGARPATWS